MNNSGCSSNSISQNQRPKGNQNIQVYVRVRPLNTRERFIRSTEVIDVVSPREIVTRHSADSKLTKKFTFDRTFGIDSKQSDVYNIVVAPLIEEVLAGYNCTVFAYGQTGTGKTHTMVGTECAELKSSWEDDSEIGIIPRALSHLFDELRLMEMEFSMRISYLELYNEELCDLLSSDDSTKIRIFDDSTKKGSVIIQGLEEIPVHSKDDVYKLLEKGKERRKTATTLMNAQSSRSHTVFSILVHIRENGMDGEEMLKIGKLNLVDLAGSENVSKAGNEKGIRVRETVNINQSLLTLGRVITALVERTPHIPYRESKLTRLLQESLGGRTKTSIIATISPGHKDIEETLSTLEYAHRAKNIQNKPEVNQKLTKKTVLKEYTEEIDKLKRDLMAARDKNGIYLAEETYNEMTLKMDSQNRELNEKMLLLKALKDELQNKEKIFNEVSYNLVEKTEELKKTKRNLTNKEEELLQTKKVLNTTKRRYKEKDFILQTHVKTEEILINQATEILKVADIATNDTHQLHNTIERRKDVDIKIQSACEKFSGRMHLNFELMDENLNNLQEHHKSHSNLIVEEITNGTKVQSKLLNCAQTKIVNLNKICENSIDSTNALCDKYTMKLGNLSLEHTQELQHLFQDLKNNDLKFKNEIQTNLGLLQTFNEEQKTTIDLMRENIVKLLESITKDLEANTTLVQTELKQIKTNVETSLEKLAGAEKQIQSELSLNVEEQMIIDGFIKKMQSVQDARKNYLEDMQAKVLETQQNEKSIILDIQQSSNNIQNFCESQSHKNKDAANKFETIASTAESIVDQNVAKCSTLQIQINNRENATDKQIDSFKLAEDKYCTSSQNLLAEYETDIKRQRVESRTNITNGCEAFQNMLNENGKRLKSHMTQTLAFTSSLENHVQDYTRTYKELMSTCERDFNTFKQSEMQTYSSTGSTPSKRVFIYPRILAATSPHQNIVKRFREEQHDWSDLDTTATIDEEVTENDNRLMDNVSDTETILNSTPIEDEKKEERNSYNRRNRDMLKSPLQLNENTRKSPKRNNSLSPLNQKLSPLKSTPQKCTPRKIAPRKSSPVHLKNNKENVA